MPALHDFARASLKISRPYPSFIRKQNVSHKNISSTDTITTYLFRGPLQGESVYTRARVRKIASPPHQGLLRRSAIPLFPNAWLTRCKQATHCGVFTTVTQARWPVSTCLCSSCAACPQRLEAAARSSFGSTSVSSLSAHLTHHLGPSALSRQSLRSRWASAHANSHRVISRRLL